ncbi:CotH kinase family protein [candidate division KSB1 bacterium]|nr:CotH kinase family protein [candidate division KSB1 bacterium]
MFIYDTNRRILSYSSLIFALMFIAIKALIADETILLPESATKQVLVPKSAIHADWRQKPDFNDASWQRCSGSPGGIGYEKSSGYESYITLDVGDDMHSDGDNPNTSCYIRIRFNIDGADLEAAKYFTLLMRYDDGFAAWLNGTKIAEANVPDPLEWNSSTGNSNESSGQAPFDVSSYRDQFIAGENLLAIQGVNASTTSSDFLINAALVASTSRYGDFSSSNLPIIFIDTHGQVIVDDPRIVADMGIIYNGPGERNNVDDLFNHYNGKIGIELRGTTSQNYPKKPYRIETIDANGENNNVSLFGMPRENDWVLQNPYYDKSLMRNIISYNLSNEMGHYAPRTQPVEVFLNNDYQGVYVLMEKIKRDKNRVDIAELDADDVAGDSLTGGYIIKIDKRSGEDNEYWNGKNVDYQYHYPKPRDLQPEQRDYIKNYILDFERVMQTNQFDDPLLGYPAYLDMTSLVDYFIINEVTRNVDGYRISTYMYKDKDKDDKVDKLKMGPIWDFNLSLGVTNWDGNRTDGWNLDYLIEKTAHEYTPPFWWAIISKTDDFQSRLLARWTEHREHVLDVDRLHAYIDAVADTLEEAHVRDLRRWNQSANLHQEVNYIKTWLAGRIAWMDENITGEGGDDGGGDDGSDEKPDGDDITDLMGTIYGSNDHLPWTGPDSDGSPDNERIEKLIDNDVNTKYLVGAEQSWLEYSINEMARIIGYAITSANDVPERDPRSWRLQGWDTASNDWVTLHSVVDQPVWEERFQTKYWQFENSDKWFSTYRLNIRAINGDQQGLMQMAELQIFGDLASDVKIANESATVDDFQLGQNYPNPFNPRTTIQYHLPDHAEVSLAIYNTCGQVVKTLVNGWQPVGRHDVQWDATDESGAKLGSGLYFYKLVAQSGSREFVEIRKMVVMK